MFDVFPERDVQVFMSWEKQWQNDEVKLKIVLALLSFWKESRPLKGLLFYVWCISWEKYTSLYVLGEAMTKQLRSKTGNLFFIQEKLV